MNELFPHVEQCAEQSCRYYGIAGITVRVSADLPIIDRTFAPKFDIFRVPGPGEDNVSIHHHFELPNLQGQDLGRRVYRKPPWAVYRRENRWIYLGISPEDGDPALHQVAVFDDEYSRGHIFDAHVNSFKRGQLHSLTRFPTDQLLLSQLLPGRHACYFHAAGMILDGQGLLFMGHSEAGKSTTVTMLRREGEILCDDRVIVRRWSEGFRVHGTWSHGDVAQVSPASAPLRAILFIEQALENRLVPIQDRKELVRQLPFFVVRPLVTVDWWQKTLDLVGEIAREVPAYRLRLDRSGRVISVLKQLLAG